MFILSSIITRLGLAVVGGVVVLVVILYGLNKLETAGGDARELATQTATRVRLRQRYDQTVQQFTKAQKQAAELTTRLADIVPALPPTTETVQCPADCLLPSLDS